MASQKELIKSRILWSSVVSAGLSVLAASLSAPEDVPSVALKLISACAAMASTAAAIFRSMDSSAAKRDTSELPVVRTAGDIATAGERRK